MESPNSVNVEVLRIGQKIENGKYTYEVTRYLGEGVTAVVYEATVTPPPPPDYPSRVALKALRPSLDQSLKENYWNEIRIIGEIRTAGVECVPVIYDKKEDGPEQFIAVQLADDKVYQRLDWVLEQKSALPEADVLEIAVQGLRLLDALHNKVQRSYTDMQLKNFNWDADNERLLVLDWNHVSFKFYVIEHGVKYQVPDVLQQLRGRGAKSADELKGLDLLRFASYLYTLLTGKVAPGAGATTFMLDELGGGKWQEVSQATRDALAAILVPSAAQGGRKYPDATTFLKDMENAQALSKNENTDALRDEISGILDQFKNVTNLVELENPQMRSDLQKANHYINRLKRISDARDEPGLKRAVERYEARSKELKLTISPRWAIGQRYFDIGSFLAAIDEWEPEAQNIGKIQLWRWVQVAKGAAALHKGNKNEYAVIAPAVQTMMGQLDKGDLEGAMKSLATWSGQIAGELPEALALLKKELETLQALIEANRYLVEKHKFEKALGILKEIRANLHVFWDKLPKGNDEKSLFSTNADDDLWRSAFGFARNLVDEAPLELPGVLDEAIENLESFLANRGSETTEAKKLLEMWKQNPKQCLDEIENLLMSSPSSPVVRRFAALLKEDQRPKTLQELSNALAVWSLLQKFLAGEDYSSNVKETLLAYYQMLLDKALEQKGTNFDAISVYTEHLLALDVDGTRQLTLVPRFLEQFKTALVSRQWSVAHQFAEMVLSLDGTQQNVVMEAYLQCLNIEIGKGNTPDVLTLQSKMLVINRPFSLEAIRAIYRKRILASAQNQDYNETDLLFEIVTSQLDDKSLRDTKDFQDVISLLNKNFLKEFPNIKQVAKEIKDKKQIGLLPEFDLIASRIQQIHALLTKMEAGIVDTPEKQKRIEQISKIQQWRQEQNKVIDERANEKIAQFDFFDKLDGLILPYLISSIDSVGRLAKFKELWKKYVALQNDPKYALLKDNPDYQKINAIFTKKLKDLNEDKSPELFPYLLEINQLFQTLVSGNSFSKKTEEDIGKLRTELKQIDAVYFQTLHGYPPFDETHDKFTTYLDGMEILMDKQAELEEIYALLSAFEFEKAREQIQKLNSPKKSSAWDAFRNTDLKRHQEFFTEVLKEENSLRQGLVKAQDAFDAFRSARPEREKLADANKKILEILRKESLWRKKYHLATDFYFKPVHALLDDVYAWKASTTPFVIEPEKKKVSQSKKSIWDSLVDFVEKKFVPISVAVGVMVFIAVLAGGFWFVTQRLPGIAPQATKTVTPTFTSSPIATATLSNTSIPVSTTEPMFTETLVPTETSVGSVPQPTEDQSTNNLPVTMSLAPEICPHAKDANGDSVYFDVPPLKIKINDGTQVDITSLADTLQVWVDQDRQDKGGVFISDPDEVKKLTNGVCKILQEDAALYWIPGQFLTSEITEIVKTAGQRTSETVDCTTILIDHPDAYSCQVPLADGIYVVTLKSLDTQQTSNSHEFTVIPVPSLRKDVAKAWLGYPPLQGTDPKDEINVACQSWGGKSCGEYDLLYKVENVQNVTLIAIRKTGYRGLFWAKVAKTLGVNLQPTELANLFSGVWVK